MSIIESLKKLVDPIQAREEEAERRTERNLLRREENGGPPPRKYRCRVCGHEDMESRFCSTCLAETMR